jgi:Rhs element Vgr protein
MSGAGGINPGGIATYVVSVAGNQIADSYSVLSVQVEMNVNRISSAVVTILDGEANTASFAASSSSTFIPGAAISIQLGYDNINQAVFSGIITGQSIRIDPMVGSALEVVCRDAAISMIVGRKSLSFSQQKDSDIISSIIGTYSGLTADVTATTTVWPEQIQYYVSDWDYIMSLAEANGMIITTLNGTVKVFSPTATTTSVLTVGYGNNLLEFNADMNAVTQIGNVQATAWDYTSQALATGQASNNLPGPGNISSNTLSQVVNLPNYKLQTTAPLQSADLTNWSNSQLIKSELAKIRGQAKFMGSSAVTPGAYITLQGLGDRFNGNYFVSGVNHVIEQGTWITEVSLGLSPDWFTEEPDVIAPPASGLLPGVRGLFNGTVKQMYQDPDSEYRILVTVPLFDPNGAGIWARLSNFYSTSGAGAFFLPEVGDEVVLGFLNEDPRYPIILGSLYNNSSRQPYSTLTPDQNNTLKAIVSKSGIVLQFDDQNKVLTLVTPNKNTIVLSDQNKQITIQDQNSNSLVMSDSGITMSSNSTITINAAQNLVLKGTQGVQIESSGGDVQLSGLNIKESANMQYSAQGGTTAQVTASAELTLKGGMVMIN